MSRSLSKQTILTLQELETQDFSCSMTTSSLLCHAMHKCKSDIIAIMHIALNMKMETESGDRRRNVSTGTKIVDPAPLSSTASGVDSLLLAEGQQFQVEGQLGISRYPRSSFLAVAKICWNYYSTLATNLHAWDTNVPSLDDRPVSNGEGKWLALLVG